MKSLLLATIILVHSWYPPECCSGRDCREVPCNEITETMNGYRYKTAEFSKQQKRNSQDEYCHVCIGGPNLMTNPYCIFLPQNNV